MDISNSNTYLQRINNDNYIVRDHRVHGIRTLPGVTLLDMIYRLYAKHYSGKSIELRNVLFTQPIVTTDQFDQHVYVTFTCRNDDWLVTIESQQVVGDVPVSGQFTQNLECVLVELDRVQKKPDLDVELFKQNSKRQWNMNDIYGLVKETKITHFEFMKALGTVYQNDSEELMCLHLSELAESYRKKFAVHPTFLDCSTLAGLSFGLLENGKSMFQDNVTYIPFMVERFRVYGSLPNKIYTYSKKGRLDDRANTPDLLYTDVKLYDGDGCLLVEFEKLTAKCIRHPELIKSFSELNKGELSAGESNKIPKAESSVLAHHIASDAGCVEASTEDDLSDDISLYLKEAIAALIDKDRYTFDSHAGFYDIGLNSTQLLDLVKNLEITLSTQLYPTLLFEYDTIEKLTNHLVKNYSGKFRDYFLLKKESFKSGQNDSSTMSQGVGKAINLNSESGDLETTTKQYLLEEIASFLEIRPAEIDADSDFYDLGLDSAQLLELVKNLESLVGEKLYPTLLFEHTNVASLTDYLINNHEMSLTSLYSTSTGNEEGRIPESRIGVETLYFEPIWNKISIDDNLSMNNESIQDARRIALLIGFDIAQDVSIFTDVEKVIPLVSGRSSVPQKFEDYVSEVSRIIQAELKLKKPGKLLFQIVLLEAEKPDGFDYFGALAGVLKCARLEHRVVSGQLIQLGRETGFSHSDISGLLNKEANYHLNSASSIIDEVQYRGNEGKRYAKRLLEQDSLNSKKYSRSTSAPYSDDGIYVITGGMGGLGLIIAQHIVKQVSPILILTGRSSLGREKMDQLVELRAAGAKVEYIQFDMGSESEVEKAFSQIRESYPTKNIKGVIHSAGVLRDQLIFNKVVGGVNAVLAPKVQGVWNLDSVTRNDPLDFFVVFSSVSALVGNIGQSDYAAANSFLDRFSEQRQKKVDAGQRYGKAISINWPLWADGGMTIDSKLLKILSDSTGMHSLPNDIGLDAFDRMLISPRVQGLVIHGDANKLREYLSPYLCKNTQSINSQSSQRDVDSEERLESRALTNNSDDIAIIGLSGRYPMANNIEQYKNNLMAGKDCISAFPKDRWDNYTFGYEVEDIYKFGGFIEDIDKFDPMFFNIAPSRAEIMDPQGRLFLQTAWEACEDAGFVPDRNKDNFAASSDCSVGVFAGAFWDHYELFGAEGAQRGEETSFGNSSASIANMVSYCLNFHGPSMAVDTMCSSALTSIHLASESIRRGDCHYAIAGGVSILTHPHKLIFLNEVGFLSSEGKCRSFGQGGDGYVPGEGVGAVLLTSLEEAESKGYPIYGVIKGSALNHSGKTSGVPAPDPVSQSEVIKAALRNAKVDPRTIGYVEAQGTGTSLGDPIEIQGLTTAFNTWTDELQYCAVGSSKSMIGHLEAASGIAGLTKILLQFQQGKMFPSLHADPLSDLIPFEKTPFYVQREKCDWPENSAGQETPIGSIPRRATLNAFGANGANANVIVEEYKAKNTFSNENSECSEETYILPISARNEERLNVYVEKIYDFVTRVKLNKSAINEDDRDPSLSGIDLQNIAYTLQVGRVAMKHRIVFIANNLQDLRLKLERYIKGEENVRNVIKNNGIQNEEAATNRLLEQVNSDVAMLDTGLGKKAYYQKILKNVCHNIENNDSAETVAICWLNGMNLDWPLLYKDKNMRRVSLPTYPFSKKRYWVFDTGVEKFDKAELESEGKQEKNVDSEPGSGSNHQEANTIQSLEISEPKSSVNQAFLRSKLEADFKGKISQLLKVELTEIDVEDELDEYGFDSILLTELAGNVSKHYDLDINPTLFFEFTTIKSLSQHLVTNYPESLVEKYGSDKTRAIENSNKPGEIRKVATTLKMDNEPEVAFGVSKADSDCEEPLAVVGVSGRFPMADDLQSFWKNLEGERDCISEVPRDRWDWRELYGDPSKEKNRTNIKWGGFIDGVDEFDPLFFGISPREAELMDPQQRLLMTYVWKAIEDAGYAPKSMAGTRTAIFVGTGSGGYSDLLKDANISIEGFSATGNVPSVGPNRMSFFLDFHGPSEPVETACSSSLVAIHRAREAIISGSCEMAVVGGVNTMVTPDYHISFNKAGMLCEDGRCKTFSEQANGYVRSEGVGMLFLKRLSIAERDGDHIYGLIRGSAVNHGGHAKSLTAPNPKAQAELLKNAYRKAGVNPRTVSYIEAHGTGTGLGDPIEINGLKSAFRDLYQQSVGPTDATPHCAIGSVKSNIGHLELAAGVAGVIKVLLQMKHKKMVKSLHCDAINPYIDLQNSPFYILQETRDWTALENDRGESIPRIAGVSSFGFGGANAHVIIEEYSNNRAFVSTQEQRNEPAIIILSSKSESQLKRQVEQLLTSIQYEHRDTPLIDIAYTLQVGREEMQERVAFIVTSVAELIEQLESYLAGNATNTDIYRGSVSQEQKLVDVFSVDDELQSAILAWIERGKYDRLLDLWVKGLVVDWQKIYVDLAPRRVSLPGYDFVRDQYWVTKNKDYIDDSIISDILHPLVHRNTSVLTQQRFSTRFTGSEFFFRDHQINGQCVLPGVAYLELVRAAVELSSDDPADAISVCLSNIVWVSPVILSEGQIVDLNVRFEEIENESIGFEVYTESSANSEHVIHAQGVATIRLSTLLQPTLDLNRIKSECNNQLINSQQCYSTFTEKGFSYGEAFQGIEHIYVGQHRVLAKLQLPSCIKATLKDYILHPSLLDSALQASISLIANEKKVAALSHLNAQIPFALQDLEILSECCSDMWAVLKYSEGCTGEDKLQKIDIDLCDDSGLVCVRMKAYTSRESTNGIGIEDKNDLTKNIEKEFDVESYTKILNKISSDDLSMDHFKELIIEQMDG